MTEIDRRNLGVRAFILAAALAVPGALLPGSALALAPKPKPLDKPATITVAYGKFSFAAPLLYVPEILKEMNIEMKGVEFQRYADTRTAIATKQADIGMTGGTLLVQSLAGGSEDLIALMGVAGEKIYPVVRDGVKIESWSDLKGKKIAAAVGGNVWTQWVAKLVEEKIPYGDLQVSGIQGGGQNFNIALKRGDIDVAILWSPFNAMPIVEGYAYWPKALEFGMSQPVGGEQGIWTVHKDVLKEKRDVIERFLWAYKAAEARVAKDEASKADAIEKFTGVKPEVAKAVAELTIYGAQATPKSLEAMAKLMAQQGIVNKDVSAMIPAHFDTSLAAKASGN